MDIYRIKITRVTNGFIIEDAGNPHAVGHDQMVALGEGQLLGMLREWAKPRETGE